jgi:outer membrane protein assembly factor BamD (BamD/ComL family)
MKKFLIIFFLIIFALVLNTCRSTTKIKPDKDEKKENPWDFPGYDTTGHLLDSLNWASARKKLSNLDYMNDIRYIRDERTQLCFAVYKNFGFQRVPCSYVDDILEKKGE